MESWKGYNYYTTDPAKWVELMNLSTPEWNIGPLPPNVVAIPGPLHTGYNFPPGTLVIENASQVNFGSREIESVIFGATSGLILLWALVWLVWNWLHGTFLQPRGSKLSSPNDTTSLNLDGMTVTDGALELGAVGIGFVQANQFEAELDIYYDDVRTELEMYEKNLRTDGVDAEDVEAGTELLRRMYDAQFGIYSMQNSHEATQSDRNEMAEKSEALFADFRKLVASWGSRQNVAGWNAEELEELSQLGELLKAMPVSRYR